MSCQTATINYNNLLKSVISELVKLSQLNHCNYDPWTQNGDNLGNTERRDKNNYNVDDDDDKDNDDDDVFVSSNAFDLGINWKGGNYGPIGKIPLRNHQNQNSQPLPREINRLGSVASSVSSIEEVRASNGRLHVSNIPFRYKREHLNNMFSIFGPVLDSEIISNRRGSKGYGFISFANTADAEKAKKALDGLVIDGRRIEINFATPRPRKRFRTDWERFVTTL